LLCNLIYIFSILCYGPLSHRHACMHACTHARSSDVFHMVHCSLWTEWWSSDSDTDIVTWVGETKREKIQGATIAQSVLWVGYVLEDPRFFSKMSRSILGLPYHGSGSQLPVCHHSAWVLYQASLCGICSGHNGIGTAFLEAIQFSPVSNTYTMYNSLVTCFILSTVLLPPCQLSALTSEFPYI
jgi:hypothetical protein